MNRDEQLEKDLQALGETFEISEVTRRCLDKTYETMQHHTTSKKYQGFVWKCACIFWVCILGIGVIGTYQPILAQDIPILYKLFVSLNQTFFKDTPYEKYAEPKALTATDHNLEVTIEEIFCDQRQFGYTYTIRSTKDKLRKGDKIYQAVSSDEIITIDGKVFEISTRYGNGNYRDDYTYTGSVIYESLILLPDQFDLTIDFKEFETMDGEGFEIVGDWHFETVVTKHTNPYSYVIQPNMKLQVSEPIPFEIEVNEIGFTPLNTYISMRAKSEQQIDEALEYFNLRFTIIDDLGQVYLPGDGGMRRNEEGVYEWLLNFSVPEQRPTKWLAIVPSVVPYEEGDWLPKDRVIKAAYTKQLPIVMKRKGVGDYIISEVRQEGEQVIVKAKAEALQNHAYLTLQLKEGSEKIGERIYQDNGYVEWHYKDCDIEEILSFELEDDGEVYDLNQMISIPLTDEK